MSSRTTWLDLVIALVVLAIIVAVATPYLLERRLIASESAATAALRSGFLPALTAYRSAAYSDVDQDGIGEFAMDHRYLAGATRVHPGAPTVPLSLIPPEFNRPDGSVIGRFRFQIDTDIGTSAANINNDEEYFGAYTVPATAADGSRAYAMTEQGLVFASKQSYSGKQADLLMVTGGVRPDNTGIFVATDALLLSDPRSCLADWNRANSEPIPK